jgi:RND family efflux transporter MFP subunit
MTRRNLSAVVRYLQQLTGSAHVSGASDAELLERYVRHRDEASFELLLWRHGTLVFNVCRRILSCQQDAEDAFQATFLAFVRKAGSISRRGSVASWLYKVAYRVALEARERTRNTAAVEKSGGERLAVQSAADPSWSDMRPILDDEVNRLPERLRRPIVLCYLEGKSNAEAAQEIGCRLGTIYSRLARGREMLRHRLLRRGVTLSVAGLTVALAAQAVEAAPAIHLMRTTVQAALSFAGPSAAVVSPRVAALAEGVLRTMFVTKLKIAAVMLFVATVLAAGGVLSHSLTAAPQPEAKAKEPPPKPKGDDKKDAKPVPVKVVKPKTGGLARTVVRQARVIAAQQQQIVPLISGTVKEVSVDIGDRVKKGQTLIVLDAPLLAKEVEEATAALEMAQAQMEESRAGVDVAQADANLGGDPGKIKLAKVVQAKAALNTAKANVRARQATLDKARIQESHTQLKAAFDGVVTRRTADPGNFVQASDSRLLTPLLTLQRTDQVRAMVQVPDRYAPFVSLGDPIDLTLDALPSVRITGQIARFSPVLDVTENTLLAEIDVPNRDGRLMPGMNGKITIHFKKRLTNALVVPKSCLLLGPNARGGLLRDPHPRDGLVFVVRGGKAHPTDVTVTAEDTMNAEIIGGVKASDLIVTDVAKLPGEGEVVPFEVEVKKGP